MVVTFLLEAESLAVVTESLRLPGVKREGHRDESFGPDLLRDELRAKDFTGAVQLVDGSRNDRGRLELFEDLAGHLDQFPRGVARFGEGGELHVGFVAPFGAVDLAAGAVDPQEPPLVASSFSAIFSSLGSQ